MMESTTIRPDSDKVTGWSTFGSGSNHFGRVNDDPADDKTGIQRGSSGPQDRYTFENVPSDFGTSNTIKVILRAKNSEASGRDVTVGLILNGSQVGTGETKTITNPIFGTDIEFTQTAWDAGFWEYEWGECEVVLTSGSGTGTLQISEVRIEIDYFKLALIKPNGDSGFQEWGTGFNSPCTPPSVHSAYLEFVDDHNGDCTYLKRAGLDIKTDIFDLDDLPSDFDASKKIQARWVSREANGDDDYVDISYILRVDSTDYLITSFTIDWGSYQLARSGGGAVNDKNWSKTQMDGALLKMRYDPPTKGRSQGIRVTALELAVSYDTA